MNFNALTIAWNTVPILASSRGRYVAPPSGHTAESLRANMRHLAGVWTKSMGVAGNLKVLDGGMCVQGALLDHLGLMKEARLNGGTSTTMERLGLDVGTMEGYRIGEALNAALAINDGTDGDWRLAAWAFEMILDRRMTIENIMTMEPREMIAVATKYRKDHGLAA